MANLAAMYPPSENPTRLTLSSAEQVEQVEVVHDIVMHVAHRRIVGGFAEARMERNDDPELVGPGPGEIETVEVPAPWKKQQRLTAAGGEQDVFTPLTVCVSRLNSAMGPGGPCAFSFWS